MTTAGEMGRRFLDLIDRNHGRIIRLCRAWCRNRTDLEDLQSEIFLQLWRSLPSYDGTAAEDTWVYRVVLNTVMLFRRSEVRRGRRYQEMEREVILPTAMPTQQGEHRELVEHVAEALRMLEPVDRALMALHLEDLPYSHIAEVTGLSANHVGVRLHRIRKRLARLLGRGKEVSP